MSQGIHSFGSGIFVAALGTAAPVISPRTLGAPWSEIGEVKKINGVPIQQAVTDLTHLQSPSKAKEKMAGFSDAGQATFGVNLTATGIAALVASFPAGAAGGQTVSNLKWCVQFGTLGLWYFEGFIQQIPLDIPEDGAITIDVTVEISGLPTVVVF